MPQNYSEQIKCSFCGKFDFQVKKIIAGSQAYICDECLKRCQQALLQQSASPKIGDN